MTMGDTVLVGSPMTHALRDLAPRRSANCVRCPSAAAAASPSPSTSTTATTRRTTTTPATITTATTPAGAPEPTLTRREVGRRSCSKTALALLGSSTPAADPTADEASFVIAVNRRHSQRTTNGVAHEKPAGHGGSPSAGSGRRAVPVVHRPMQLLQMLGLVLLVLAGSAPAPADARLESLTEQTWREMLDGEWMVAFFAPWCPACRSMHGTWNDFGDWSAELNIRVAQVDITQNPGLSGRFMVTALPTIYHVKDGVFRQYQGGRDRDSLMNFIDAKKWTQIKPISAWKQPDSVQMSTVAQFFRWSYQIRGIHTYLVDQGIPYWASYGLFALATIIIGAVLGLLIVACIDHVFPPKTLDYRRMDEVASYADDSEDIADESSATTTAGAASEAAAAPGDKVDVTTADEDRPKGDSLKKAKKKSKKVD